MFIKITTIHGLNVILNKESINEVIQLGVTGLLEIRTVSGKHEIEMSLEKFSEILGMD